MVRWLPGASEVVAWTPGAYTSDPRLADPQALLCFDSGDTSRLGGPHRELPRSAALVNVDHHVSNTRYGVLNWVDEAAPSVGEMVFRLLRATGMPVDADVALNLYLSLVEDTGRFSYSNTTPEALRAAADLVAAGARPETVTNHLFRNEDLGTMRLRARCVERLRTAADGRLATTYVTWADLEELGLLEGEQGREMVEVAIGLEGTDVGILFRGLRPGEGTKVSCRSKTDFDVAAVCTARGGGGHKKAAGCTVKDDDLARARGAHRGGRRGPGAHAPLVSEAPRRGGRRVRRAHEVRRAGRAARYARRSARRDAEERALLARVLPPAAPGATVLDAPCGVGRLAAFLLERGYAVRGADLSPAMREGAEAALGPHPRWLGVEPLDLEAPATATAAAYDLVLCFRFLHHLPDAATRARVLRSLAARARGP